MRRPARLVLLVACGAALALSGSAAAIAAPPSTDTGITPFVPTLTMQGKGGSVLSAPLSSNTGKPKRTRELRIGPNRPHPGGGGGADGALQAAGTYGTPNATIGANFDGVGVGINSTYADCCAPPDTNAAVGATQVVEWVNLDVAVFDKNGVLLMGPIAGNSIWSGFTGGNCGTNNDGDPVVKYDQLRNRWVMQQFSVTGGPPFYECIAVSSGSDFLTSTWSLFSYSFGSNFPDYPKIAVWGDNLYMSFNLFANGRSFSGSAACAFDLGAGSSGRSQCYQLSTSFPSLLPSDLDGAATAPAGSPDYFLNFGSNVLNLWKFSANFATSTFSFTGPTTIAVPTFSQACNGGGCVPQAGTSQSLDSLGDRLMFRLAYRNFTDHESLVVNHSVTGSGTAAPRWYELRTGTGTTSAVGSGSFQVYQRSSYVPDATYRWMGSAAMDKFGNLAVGFSASSSSINPSIRFATRLAGDALNTLRSEQSIQVGTGSQSGSNLARWGDYSSMAVDPVNDCTFWYANEYLKTTGAFNWSTRLASFKLPGC